MSPHDPDPAPRPHRAGAPSTPGPRLEILERGAAQEALADELAAALEGGRIGAIGLATGSTMTGLYSALGERVDASVFHGVQAFLLDEYLDLAPEHPLAFASYARRFIEAPLGVAHGWVIGPETTASDPAGAAARYEERIAAAGGLDVCLLGLGRNGHVAFNEPGSPHDSRTRVVELATETREDAAASFGGLEHVPQRAITIGIATILDARSIRVLAFGAAKQAAVADLLAGPIEAMRPSSALRGHGDVVLRADAPAASRAKRI